MSAAETPIRVVDISDDTDPMEWTEEQLREDFARRGWDYDAIANRGLDLVERLAAEHRARAAARKARQS